MGDCVTNSCSGVMKDEKAEASSLDLSGYAASQYCKAVESSALVRSVRGSADLYPHFLPNSGQLGKRSDRATGDSATIVLTCWITIKTQITPQDQ